jgi:hypothetical protein
VIILHVIITAIGSIMRPITRCISVFFLICISNPLFAQEDQNLYAKLFEEVEERFHSAREQLVHIYAPKTYAEAQELYSEAVKAYKGIRQQQRVRGMLRETNGLLDSAFKISRSTQMTLAQLIDIRQDAESCDYSRAFPEGFTRGEIAFERAIHLLEEGNIDAAQREIENAARAYREMVVHGLMQDQIQKVDDLLRESERNLLPEIFRKAENELTKLKDEIRTAHHEPFVISRYIGDVLDRIDVILIDLFPPVTRPDTLIMGSFKIVIERYDHLGSYSHLNKQFKGLDGIGRIKFDCLPKFTFPVFPVWKGEVLQLYYFIVVGEVKDPIREISLNDARLVNAQIQIGDQVSMQLPIARGKYFDIARNKAEWLDWLKPKPDGIRVHFEGLNVSIPGPAHTGLVIKGIAAYPAIPSIPVPPLTLFIGNFSLQIDSLTLDPAKAVAQARLFLPNTLTSGSACESASLNLGSFEISPGCEFYVVHPDSVYGPIEVGNTTVSISGKGFVADFRSDISYGPSGKGAFWKGVWLFAGESHPDPNGSVTSNAGYLKALYTYPNAEVTSSGLKTTLTNKDGYDYHTLQPYGYHIAFQEAIIELSQSKVSSGRLDNGSMFLPTLAVRDAGGNPVKATFFQLEVQSDMGVYGAVSLDAQELHWGDWVHTGQELRAFSLREVKNGYAYFSAEIRTPFMPAAGNTFVEPNLFPPNTQFKSLGLQGVTFVRVGELDIYTPDIPQGDPALHFALSPAKHINWINVVSRGVHASLISVRERAQNVNLGPDHDIRYVGKIPFKTIFGEFKPDRPEPFVTLKFVESAAFESDFRGYIALDGPSKINLDFDKMVFTSTAHNAGGQVDLSTPDTLDYWGVAAIQKPGFSSAGLVSVKSGQVILTAAGLSEQVHYTEPFYLTWGEMLATGEFGRLFFDYNTAGQKFDGFDFVTQAVALSDYEPSVNLNGYLQTGGNIHFPFFGPTYLQILDWYVPGMSAPPNFTRLIELGSAAAGNFLASELDIGAGWSSGLGRFDFTLAYSDGDQDGFIGDGESALMYLIGGAMSSHLDMKSRGTCISISPSSTTTRSLTAGPVANLSMLTRIWGCVCLEGDQIKLVTVGGEVTVAGNVSMVVRTAASLTAIMLITPSITQLTMDGEAYLSIAASVDVLVNGHFSLLIDRDKNFLEGEITGQFRFAEGAIVVGNSLEAKGEANWHFGAGLTGDHYQSVQGALSINIMGVSSMGLGAGFYFSVNAPKEKAWVLMGSDPRYRLKTSALPATLTGMYGFLHVKKGINLYVVSGGYEIFVGFGMFVLDLAQVADLDAKNSGIPGSVFLVGNLGGRIHGEILGGLVSAAAGFNFQVIGPYPASFHGSVTLEACVLWVACGSVNVAVGMNTSDGFYIE